MNAQVSMVEGEAVGTGLPVENPATGEVFASAPVSSPAELDATVGAAADAAGEWAALTEDERRSYLDAAGVALGAQLDEVARILTLEQGKPIARARAEVQLAADWFGLTAALRLAPESLCDDGSSRITMHRVPLGVVAAVTPSNYPIILAVCKIAPALLAGNPVVLKPSPDTPLSSLAMMAALQEILPPGVLNVVNGDGDLGRCLVRHPDVRKVSFTGSIDVGTAIARDAADGLKRVTLELGGNDPAIVLPGADLEAIAPALFWVAFENSGQFCSAIKRVYVPAAQRDRLAGLLADIARSARVGAGEDAQTELGPLTTRRQLDRVADFVDQAVAGGARVWAGGERLDRPGHFLAPTVLTEPPAGSLIEVEEQFGPALPVIGYDTVESAVRRANATRYGLGASVWGDEDAATRAAAAVRAGTVWLNKHGDLRADAPFGGVGSSGIGVEYGYWGLLEYTQVKVVNQQV
jgi:acyl-CoA reductase-like NAD-dependent aldehyde dehydrogenase